MNSTNILANLLVAIKTSYIGNNKYAYSVYNTVCLDVLFQLYKEGLISSYQIEPKLKKVKIKLKYLKNKPLINDCTLLSKPSFKYYTNYNNLKYLNAKYDYFFISTSKGILSSKELNTNFKIGGQLLFGLKLNNY